MSPEADKTGTDTVVDTQQTQLVDPDAEGSLSDILEKSKGPVFEGHPADAEGAAGPEGEAGSVERTAEQIEADRIKEEEAAAAKKAEEAKPTLKYKSQEEAEAAQAEAARKMHEATEEAARLREEIKTRDEAAKTAKETAEAEAAQRKPEEIRAEAKTKVKTALATIRGLDEEDPEYDEKVADAWATAGVGAASVAAAPDRTEIAKIVDEQVKLQLKTERDVNAEKDRETANARVRENAHDLAAKAGLAMEKGTADYRLFWDVAKDVPTDVAAQPLSDQVSWAVDEVHRLKGEVVKTKEQKAAEAKRLQQQQAPLEAGPTRVVTKPKEESYSINTIVGKQQEARRI